MGFQLNIHDIHSLELLSDIWKFIALYADLNVTLETQEVLMQVNVSLEVFICNENRNIGLYVTVAQHKLLDLSL